MYGTVATFRVQPGKAEELQKIAAEDAEGIAGLVFEYTYQTDDDPNVLMIVVGFESKDAYWANAKSPEQNARYERFRALLTADPEWHDGEIVSSTIR
jgi:quinol monooxygenase YgiN